MWYMSPVSPTHEVIPVKTRSSAFLAAALSVAVALGVSQPASAAPAESAAPPVADASVAFADEPVNEAELESAFSYIEDIPDHALTSQEAFDTWQAEQPAQAAGAAGCALSITVFIASNAFAVAKIAKIKAAIKAAGGAKKFASKAIDAYKYAKNTKKMSRGDAIAYAAREAASAGGEDVVNALVDLLSARGVAEDCFGADL